MTKLLNATRQYGSFFPQKKLKREVFKFSIPQDEVFHSCRLTILDTHFGGVANIENMPDYGKKDKGEIVVSWQCEGSADVKFQVEAFSQLADSTKEKTSVTGQKTKFLPSLNGWPFDNIFEAVPPFKLIGELRYGDASKGLCGGMVYAALDYFVAGLDLPSIPEADLSKYKSPLHGPIFDYLGKRLFNSFDIPKGVMSYVELMLPDFPDFQKGRRYPGLSPQSRAWRTIRQEWPTIKSKLDAGHPCPLGLVRIKSADVSKLGENHQVLAYGYDLVGDDLTLNIYDPNYHNNDNINLKLNIGDPGRKLDISYCDNKPVFCFFRTNYSFSIPPDVGTAPGRIILFEDEYFCGKSIDIVREHNNLGAHKAGNFRNFTSSFVILSGTWRFYRKPEFEDPIAQDRSPIVLGPGTYRRVKDYGIQDNEIISLRAEKTRVLRRK